MPLKLFITVLDCAFKMLGSKNKGLNEDGRNLAVIMLQDIQEVCSQVRIKIKDEINDKPCPTEIIVTNN